jgi:hypothetical protein
MKTNHSQPEPCKTYSSYLKRYYPQDQLRRDEQSAEGEDAGTRMAREALERAKNVVSKSLRPR